MSKDRQVFYDASLQYVFKIQEVQERKKFEFVEPVSARMQLACCFVLSKFSGLMGFDNSEPHMHSVSSQENVAK